MGVAFQRYGLLPIEMRVTAADDALPAPRTSATPPHPQYRGMEWRPYFEAVEEIMNEYGGPHWNKRHFQTAATLAALLALGGLPGGAGRARSKPASSATSTPSASSVPDPR